MYKQVPEIRKCHVTNTSADFRFSVSWSKQRFYSGIFQSSKAADQHKIWYTNLHAPAKFGRVTFQTTLFSCETRLSRVDLKSVGHAV